MQEKSLTLIEKLLKNAKQGKRKFSSLSKAHGVLGAIKQTSKNIFLIETVCRLDKDLDIKEQNVQARIPLTIKVLAKGFDLNNWAGRNEIINIRGDYGLEQFKQRLDRGDLCFAAYSKGNFVGYIWVEFPPVREAGYSLLVNEAFTYDGWTFDEFRGNRVMPFIQQAITNYIRENHPEIQNIVTHVATWNKASLSGDQRAGYKIKRIEITVVIFGIHKKILTNRKISSDLVLHQKLRKYV